MSSSGESPRLTTLGELSLGPFHKTKPLLLLSYLALEGPTPRRSLRALLWPHAQQPDASLRVALHQLKRVEPLSLSGDELLACGVPCDAAQLLTLRGEAAVSAYTGVFLHGVTIAEVSAEYEEWVEAQRARLAAHVQDEALRLAENSAPDTAARLAERAYRLPGAPLLEAEGLRRLLPLTLPGSTLETEVRAELDSLSDAGSASGGGGGTRPPRRMLGRAADLDALLAWATRPGAWLALVSGPGGIGKSTLTRELLRELSLQQANVTLVDAEGATQAGDLLPRLALARAPGQAVQDTWAGLEAVLGQRPIILLDGLDDLHDLDELLATLHTELPQARWVLTGRRQLGRLSLPLGLPSRGPAEVGGAPGADDVLVLPLGGLDTPQLEAALPEIAASSAVALFLREAARVRRDFTLTSGNAARIAGLTRRLVGHPLALALAASWLRVEDLEAVYARVLQDAAVLSSPGGDGDGRRGLLLVAQRSWDLLSPSEQGAALRLHAAPDFDPADAPALGVPSELLDALVDHSFLEIYQPGSERLRVYPALTGVLQVQAQAQPEQAAAARAAHARHYLDWFAAQAPESPPVDAERGNLRQAISSALQDGSLTAGTVEHLLAHFDRRGLHTSGTEVFAVMSDEAEDAGAPAEVQAAVQISCMWLAYRSGRLLDAQTLAVRFLQGPLAADPASRMKVLNTLATVRAIQGQWRSATELLRQAVSLAAQIGDRQREVAYRTNLLANLLYWEDLTEVQREYAALTAFVTEVPEQVGWQIRQRLLGLGAYLPGADLGALSQEARLILETGERTGNLTMMMVGLLEGSRLSLLGNQLREAELLMTRLRMALKNAESKEVETDLAILETRWLYARGRTPQARQSARRALMLTEQRSNPWELTELLLVTAADLAMHDPEGVQFYLSAVANAENVITNQRQQARERVESASTAASPLNLKGLRDWLRQQLDEL